MDGLLYFLPAWLRSFGFLLLAPVGTGASSIAVKFSFAFALAVLVSTNQQLAPELNIFTLQNELILGSLISLPLWLAHWGITGSGAILDSLRGESLGAFYDLSRDEQVSPLAALLSSYSWMLILISGIFDACLATLVKASAHVTSGEQTHLATIKLAKNIFYKFPNLVGDAFLFGSAVGLSFLLVEIFVGLALRMAPKLQCDKEIFMIKTALAFVLIKIICEQGIFSYFAAFTEVGAFLI